MFTIGGTSNRGFYPFEPTGSLRFEDGDSPYLQRTPTTAGNLKTWTFSCWIKRGNISEQSNIFNPYYGGDGSNESQFYFHSDDTLRIYDSGALRLDAKTSALFRDASAWYHIVLRVDTTQATDSDRLRIYVNGEEATIANGGNGGPTYPTQNQTLGWNGTSAHYVGSYRGSNHYLDGYMAEIYHVDGTSHDADTFGETKNGVWVPKDAKGSLTFGTNGFYLPFNSTVTAEGQSTVLYEGTGATQSVQGMGYKADLVWLKNRSATSNHALSDRVRGASRTIYPNLTAAQDYLGANQLGSFNDDGFTILGSANNHNDSGEEYVAWAWDAGADQTPTGFGCVTWRGSGGANRAVRDVGFKSDLVWVKTRDAANDHNLFDSVRGATKRLRPSGTNAEATDVNSVVSFDDDGFTVDTNADYNGSSNDYVAWCWDAGDGDPVSNTDGSTTTTVKASDTHGFSIVTYQGNGTVGNTIGHGLNGTPDVMFIKGLENTQNWVVYHKSLSATTKGLALNTTAAENQPFQANQMTATTMGLDGSSSMNGNGLDYVAYFWKEVSGYSKFGSYTGTGSAGNAVTGLGFRPAFVMIKRTDSAGSWYIHDSTRNPHNPAEDLLSPNNSDAEATFSNNKIDLDSDGFTIQGTAGDHNASGGSYIYMAFAGGLDTIAPVNTDGSIDSRVKASDDTGFSIVRYRGTGANATISHGLSSAPDWIVTKGLSTSGRSWAVYHSGIASDAETDYLLLNSTAAAADNNIYWNDTAPTSSVFSVGTASNTNQSGVDFIAYCWTATTGKSAFGSYTGNGSATGPEVTGLGFEPGLVILKNTDDVTNWYIYDDKRGGLEDNDEVLLPNSNLAESSNFGVDIDLNDDGFQVVTSSSRINGSGHNVIYMAFADGRDASFFHDESGQDNHFEPENVQNYDVVPDSPTNNFATMNPLNWNVMTFAEGNLKISTTTNNRAVHSTFALPSSGKWIYEFRATDYTSGGGAYIGFSNNMNEGDNEFTGDHGIFYQTYNGGFNVEGTVSTATGYSVGSTNFTADGDMHTIAIDVDNQKLYFAKNGNWRNDADPAAGTGGLDISSCFTSPETSFSPCITRGGSYNEVYHFNFGQDDSFAGTVTPGGYTDANERGSFKYPVPDGFLSLCTANLPEPDISPSNGQEPEDYFNTVLYTGTGAELAVTGVGFQPDWVWAKERNNAEPHRLFDSVRGATKALESDSAAAENTNAQFLKTFDSDGFTLGTSYPNNSGDTYVAWNWLAGGTAVSNTDGTVTADVSASAKSGFSIVSWDGADASAGSTIGHGLGKAPSFIVMKNRNLSSGNWHAYHKSLTADYGIVLNLTNQKTNDSGFWNDTEPTSSVFTVGTYGATTGDHIAYCFSEIEGYSKFGTYTGAGDGTFVHLGFRPAWLMVKNTDTSSHHWAIYDDTRDTYNVNDLYLYANSSSVESDNDRVDFVSNGFVGRANNYDIAQSGVNFIYIAFARNPFKYAQAR
ncbi:virion structural protein [Phage C72C1]|nr:virion structural protein [Phage C72C1]